MFQVGDRVGDYEIAAKLKAGGMATLFLGRRAGAAGFSRHVAIKVVHGHLAGDQTFVRMFLDEALLSARIHHPNVVHVEELGEADGTYFLVMEYVHGCALNQVLRALAKQKRKLSPEMAVWIAIQVADGLHAAHEAKGDDGQLLGVVHRDVSPQNVLLAYKGHVKLIDFGIAKARGRAQQTATGASIKGKLRYMSPEQAFGRGVDRTTDVYALAIVLWEMLTMRKMFDADNDFALLDMVRCPQVVPPSTYGAGIPEALDRAILSALAADPSDRPLTARDFRRRLAEAMPAAATLDADALAELLETLMSDEMDNERRALPESLTGFPSGTDRAAPRPIAQTGQEDREEIVHTVALDISDIAFLEDGASAPSQQGEFGGAAAPLAVQQIRSFKRATATGTDAGLPRPGGTVVAPNSHTQRLQPLLDTDAAAAVEKSVPAARTTSRSMWIGAAALVGVAVVGGALIAKNSSSRHEVPTTTASSRTSASAAGNTPTANPGPTPVANPGIVAHPTSTVQPTVVNTANAGSSTNAVTPTAVDAGSIPRIAAAGGEPSAGPTPGRTTTTRRGTGARTTGTTSNTGARGTSGSVTRIVNGVPIVSDDF